ncbi:hypothetical protein [Chitinophaga nivalis]|uniref:Uncharacterized protein n=1 Tax=Chitinophaga nivalis TaxID=2991709 RepID=A0ABT3IMS9_9BACT|nr:hypothetical protein [Chitinophaga nivalis]MCW3465060.1 hypothetical protein [Chitinophaga nivalis]MCW3485248.1 hypothetical protein [Chitinophaga nivalis]
MGNSTPSTRPPHPRLLKAILLLLSFSAHLYVQGQIVNERLLKAHAKEIGDGDGHILPNTIFIKVMDGVVFQEGYAPLKEVEQEWVVRDSATVSKMTNMPADSVLIMCSPSLPIEKYIYQQVEKEIAAIPGKVPILLNERFMTSHKMRKLMLQYLKPSDIRKITFLSKEAAQKKYGNEILFGAIEVSTNKHP